MSGTTSILGQSAGLNTTRINSSVIERGTKGVLVQHLHAVGSGGAPENAVAPAVNVAVTGLVEGVAMPRVISLRGGIPGGAVGIGPGVMATEPDAELAPDAELDAAEELAPDTELTEMDETAADGADDDAGAADDDVDDDEDDEPATRGAACLLCLTRFTS